jgi:hypothetical protein
VLDECKPEDAPYIHAGTRARPGSRRRRRRRRRRGIHEI